MHIPKATYRIQFNPSFGFQSASEIVPYLSTLGISHIYASPVFRARSGSVHGYDIVDPNQLNPDLGLNSEFEALIGACKNAEMGWLQDIVPNHMAFHYENQTLVDVLENGQSSQYYHFFDIEWDHPYESVKSRVLAPFLGRFYSEALESGELSLKYDRNGFAVTYYDLLFPLRIESYARVLTYRLDALKGELGRDHPDYINLLGVLYVLETLESRDEVSERYDQMTFIKRMLWELYNRNQEIRHFIDENTRLFSGIKGDPESFTQLDDLLHEQFFRLSFWKVANEEINYRRFFNINELICLRLEDDDVLNQTHTLIFALLGTDKINGLRIDHVDGLYDPAGYLEKVRKRAGDGYIVVEKILGLEEALPSSWPVQGTTGYDFMNYLNGLFCVQENEKELNRVYTEFTGLKTPHEQLLSEKRRLIIDKHMGGDVDNLALLLKAISSRDRYGRDITLYGLRRALVEVLTFFPVYRTYIGEVGSTETDLAHIETAVEKAVKHNPALSKELYFIQRFLKLEFEDYLTEEEKTQWIRFTMKIQQLTGPLMAKGFEDTTLYVYNRLLSLNEVGGNPNKFGVSLLEFHGFMEKRRRNWPHSLSATSTHDTKRGEDVRARINVLSEIPKEWEQKLRSWRKINRKKKRKVGGTLVPDRNDEYFFYQTLIGAFPFYESEFHQFKERIKEYIIKAVREAKVHTAWLKADTDYEDAYISFVENILEPSEGNPFFHEFFPFQKRIAHYGILNSLSQTLIKISSPGVPDFYQGTELWDLNLVDPDNRRPVDFEKRKEYLKEIRERSEKNILDFITELLSMKEDGRVKFFLIYRALNSRKQHTEPMQDGTYTPLEVRGEFEKNIIAFARNWGQKWAITICPRFLTSLIGDGEYPIGQRIWGGTHVVFPENSPTAWRDAITDQLVEVEDCLFIGEALKHFPVSLLISR